MILNNRHILLLLFFVALVGLAVEPQSISVTVDGSVYQCSGNASSPNLSYCSCTDSSSNQLWWNVVNAQGKTIVERLIFDYDAPEKCLEGMKTQQNCRRNGSAGLIAFCSCTDSSSNQVWLQAYDNEGKKVVDKMLYDFGSSEECQAGLATLLSCAGS